MWTKYKMNFDQLPPATFILQTAEKNEKPFRISNFSETIETQLKAIFIE